MVSTVAVGGSVTSGTGAAIVGAGRQLAAVGDGSQQQLYKYQPLPAKTGSFRVLQLYPAEYINDPIRCRLHDAHIGDGQKFEALSYRWGDAGNPKTVKLDGRNFTIQWNLWLFLRQLRRTGHQMIWVDAVCIDQSNLDERAKQVQFMNQIYAAASQTLVWLGESGDDSAAAFEFLQYMDGEQSPGADVASDVYKKLFGTNEDTKIWGALEKLCGREYWARLWIIQEVILASNLTLYCGERSLSWGAFKYACAGPATMRGFAGVESTNSEAVHKAKIAITKSQFGELSHQRALEQRRYLWQLLQAYSAAECVDLRDRIYGLLGLSRDHAGDKGLRVDYTRSELALIVETLATSYVANTDVISFGRLILHSLRLDNSSYQFWEMIVKALQEETHPTEYLKKARSIGMNGLKTLFKGSSLEETFDHKEDPTVLDHARDKRSWLHLDYRGKVTRLRPRRLEDDHGTVFETENHITAITYGFPDEGDLVFSIKSTPIGIIYRPNSVRTLRCIGWTISDQCLKELKFFWGNASGVEIGQQILKSVDDVSVRQTVPGTVVFQVNATILDIMCLLPTSVYSMREANHTWGRAVPVRSTEHWNELCLNAFDSSSSEPSTPIVADLSSLGGGDPWGQPSPEAREEPKPNRTAALVRSNRSR